MKQEDLINGISKLVEDNGFFVVDIQMNTNGKILVFMDGLTRKVTIEDCIAVSRSIMNSNEEIAEKYGIEVSSPGLDHPFKVLKQYQKNIGNEVTILLKDGKRFSGKLTKVDSDKILLEEIKIRKEKKKKIEEKINHEFSFEQIKATKQII